ncbi:MAG: metallophosphoesterase [Pedobacter sp.]|nr:MAG: metallophosphoesterase [Pedobacter sp.]
MRKLLFYIILLFLSYQTQGQNFRYAFVTDTHIGTSTGEEDLRRTVNDINAQSNLDFVVLTGDITEMGTNAELRLAKEIISGLKIPYYIIPGNHDTGWSETGGVSFIKEFGDDKFYFKHKGYHFIACASGPYVRMSDGHIPRDATVWLDKTLKKIPEKEPIIFINHYPIDESLDNWYEITDRFHKRNIQYMICGHGHTNKAMSFEGIPATMGRSNLRANDTIGGYNIVSMYNDSVTFSTKKPGQDTLKSWRQISLQKFDKNNIPTIKRPDYDVNNKYNFIQQVWSYHSDANVVNTPVVVDGKVIFGNSLGMIEALDFQTGKKLWNFKTKGAIYSSAQSKNGLVVIGSGDGYIYALNTKNGKIKWKIKTNNAVLSSPLIDENTVYIGGSDNTFRALNLGSGKLIWEYNGVEGNMVGKTLLYENKLIFGSWGKYLYAIDKTDGSLLWKWTNGSANRMFSPAMVTPVATKGVVYIAAPDRFLTAIDSQTGETIWRTKEATVRESIGISEDNSTIYGKTMNDYIVGFETNRTAPILKWSLNAGYGYEHTPSDLIEKNGVVIFGTKNGVVYAFSKDSKEVLWKHKIDNSMINTVHALDDKNIIVSTMDGKVVYLKQ